ncbi:MAG: sensor histidine kinase [Promethearchaeota archaeon]
MVFTNLFLELIYALNTILPLLFFSIVLFYLIDSKDLRTQKNKALLGMYGGITGYSFSYFLYISFLNQEGVEVLNSIVSILTIASISTFLVFLCIFVVVDTNYPYHTLTTKVIIGVCLFFGFFTIVRYLMFDMGSMIFDSLYQLFLSDIWFFSFLLLAELLIGFTVIVFFAKPLTDIFFPKTMSTLIRRQYLKYFGLGGLLGGISELIKVTGSTVEILIIAGITYTVGLTITILVIFRTREHIRDIAWKIIEVQMEELKELDVLKSQFIDFVSHEIRTPLSIMWGNIELLQQGETGRNLTKQQRKKIYDSINRNYHRIEKLLDASFDLSRIRRNLFELNKKQSNLEEIVENFVNDITKYVEKNNLKITFMKEGNEAPDQVMVDADRIDQVLRNLIENSVKFSNDGEIIVTLRNKPHEYIVSVKDEGIGIHPDKFDQLFSLFEPQGNTKIHGQGLGLGLYISKSIIELHQGMIWVKSEGEGKGSTFYFSIPK